jgi:hypothetical protein
MVTFSDRLNRCAGAADLTLADLSRWFDRPHATVNTWRKGRTPFGPAGREAEADLERLEHAVRFDSRLPIPPKLTPTARIHLLQEVRNVARRNCRVSTLRPAG